MIGKTISHYNILRRTMVLLLLAASVAFPQNQKPKFERISIEQGLSQSGITSIFQDNRGLLWFGANAGLNKYDGYRFTVYKHDPNDPNSLSTNEVGTTVEDERGALWISTWGGGLNRFDPETEAFTHWKHDPDDPTSLSDDYITDIHLDSCHDGVLWIATEYGGLNRFDPETGQFTRLMPKWVIDREATHGTTEKFIMPIHEDAGGDLWMGIGGGGLNRFNRDTETFDRWMPEAGNPESISFEFVEFICEDPHGDDGVLWVATHGGGLNRFDIESETFTRWRHEPGNPNSLSSDYIFSLYADTFAGGLWIGTDGGGLNRFDIKADTFSHWRNDPDDPNSLSDNKITNIHEDRTGALWIGTLGGGICKLNRNERQQNRFFHRQHDPDDPRSLSQNNVSAIYEDKAGAIWVGTYGGGLNRFDSQTGTFEFWLSTPKDTIGSGMNIFYPQANNIIAIHEDYHGILWIGTYGGKLFQFDRETERFVYWPFGQNFLNHIFTKYILSFYENAADSGRILWLGTRANYGLAKMIRNDEGSGDFLHWGSETENPDAINSNDVFCIYGDESGRLWLGTGGGGVNIFDPKTEKFTHLLNEPGNPNSLGSNVVNCIYTSPADSGAILWLGTEAGLNKLVLEDRNPETARFFHFKEKDGLPNDYICGILADDRGNLWLSTLNGLSRFDPKTETFRNYDAHDGLQGGEFTRGAAFKTRSGEMHFGGTNGLNSFHPDSLRDNPHIPPILITDFQILNEPIEISPNGETPLLKHVFATNEIVLSHRDNVFSFEFAALDYNAPQKNQYAYMMEGFDEDWIYSGSRRFVTYTNLDPGKYVFRVKGSNNDGVWNEEGTFVRIIITPPWWQTWWAYALYTVLIALALYGARRLEIARVHLRNELRLKDFEARHLHEVDQMKSRFFANISHEFRTPLTLILGPLKMLLSGDFQGEPQKQFRMMHRSGQRLLRLINQLLDLSKIDAGGMFLQARPENIVRLLRYIVSQFSSLAERNQIALKLTVPDESISVFLDRDKLEKIMYNLLANAFKFTPKGGEVAVAVARAVAGERKDSPSGADATNFLEITVSDSGIGIQPDHLDKIFDRFHQIDDSPLDNSSPTGRSSVARTYATEQKGTGIGLALTKELVELHRGWIEVRSEQGRGSTFVVYLPLGKGHLNQDEIFEKIPEVQKENGFPDKLAGLTEEELPELGSVPDKEKEAPHKEERPTILIVEDNRDMRNYMCEILNKDYRLLKAADGAQGFEKAVDRLPDQVISDVMMPEMDGFELCRKLKTDGRTSHIPVILLTARASGESKIEGLETGADDYITKPFDAQELQVRVKNLIEQRRKLRQRFHREIIVRPKEIAITSMDQALLQRAMDIVEEHIADSEFSVEIFSKKIGMSRVHLSRKLKALTDHSANEFIRTMRLKRAAQHLEAKSATVVEIAYEVGFNNPSYFAECFRKQFGKSPSRFVSSQ